PLHIPFVVNVAVSMALVCFYTQQGGVRTLIWTDSLKTLCLIVSVGMCIYYIATDAGADFSTALHTPIFFFDDVNDKQYFFKQFVAGIFIVIAMTGLDQDMMQKVLSCKNPKDSQKNMLVSAVLQMGVIFLLLVLGALLYLFAASKNVALPAKSDDVFPMLATGGYFPPAVGMLFIIGLISAAYASVGSSLTSLTTSLSVDILGAKDISPRQRRKHHAVLALLMGLIIIVVNLLNNSSVINVVFTLVSYSYGPILGLFAFGILTKCAVKDKWVPVVAVLSPLLCWIIDVNSVHWLGGYKFSYELLMMNAAFMFLGMLVVTKNQKKVVPLRHEKKYLNLCNG
uniref:sodium:solute symporter family transporter n=1 Tax=Candidatus Symbiothrix dinenymphae TaxID=467085 RepID=UPI0007032A3C